jgi:DNA-binding transcriptional ArsR family regulator
MTAQTIYQIQAELCQTMAHALRLEILHLIRDNPKSVGEIAAGLGEKPATISRHLAALRNAGVVLSRRDKQTVYYQISNPKLVTVCNLMREVLAEQVIHQSEIANSI